MKEEVKECHRFGMRIGLKADQDVLRTSLQSVSVGKKEKKKKSSSYYCHWVVGFHYFAFGQTMFMLRIMLRLAAVAARDICLVQCVWLVVERNNNNHYWSGPASSHPSNNHPSLNKSCANYIMSSTHCQTCE